MLGVEVTGWKSELGRELAEINCWLDCLLKFMLVMCLVTIANKSLSEIRSWKLDFVRELAEVNCWLLGCLKWCPIRLLVTIANGSSSEIRSWKSELVRELAEVNCCCFVFWSGGQCCLCYNLKLVPVWNQKLEVGASEGIGGSQLLMILSVEV